MNDKQQLQAMGEHQAEQHMCMAKQIEDLQARLQECANGAAKVQEQRDAAYVMAGKSGLERDKFAQQLKAANQQIAVMAESLREAVSVLSSINHGREHRVIIDYEPAFWQRDEWVSWATGDVLPMLRAALSCELPDHIAGAGKMVPEGWQIVPAEPTHDMLHVMIHCDHFDIIQPEMAGKYYRKMLAAAPKLESTK